MENKVLSATEKELIAEDQRRSHAVCFINCSTEDETGVEERIEEGLESIRDRAATAKMVILSTTVAQSSHAVGAVGHVCLSIICAWARVEDMERMARQQQLAQQTGPMRARG